MTFPYSFSETLTLYDINAEAQSLFSLLLLEKVLYSLHADDKQWY
jgi:hypothetical protein